MRKIVNFGKLFEQSESSVWHRTFRHQLLATLTVNILTFSHGIGLGWFSPTLTKLRSEDSPLNFDIAINEASWMGSMIGLGALVGASLFGTLLDRVGRKICLYMLAVPHTCLWVLIYSAKSVEFLYVGRFLGGMTGGCSYVVIPMFVSEIADASIRGTLGSVVMLSVNFGVLCGYILATHLEYHLMPCIVLILPIIYLVANIFFPETPQHLLRKGKVIAAEASYKFYKNCGNGISYSELQKCNQGFDELKSFIAKGNSGPQLSYRDFVTKPALKALCTSAVLLIVNQFCGIFAFVNYMSTIFAEADSSIDPNTCTIIMGAVQIFGVYSATLFADRFGRKILMLFSTAGVAVGLVAFGLFTFYAKRQDLSEFGWVPLVLMTVIVFLANMGIVALTFVLLVEIFPAKIRSVAASGSLTVLCGIVFVMLKIFPTYMDTFGISVSMWSCSVVSFAAFVYLLIFLPETNGKNMEAD